MLFNSVDFIIFLAIVFCVYYGNPVRKMQIPLLIVSSMFFYGYTQPWLLILLILSSTANGIICFYLAQNTALKAKQLLILGVLLNLGVLGLFKYASLFFGSLPTIWSSSLGVLATIPLPIGISFYTFQGISLVVDSYREADFRNNVKRHN